MKKLILIVVFAALNSCSSDNENSNAASFDAKVIINLQSEDGVNLLNTSNYNPNSFKVYYKVGNEFIEQNNNDYDYPKNFFVDTESNPSTIHLFMNMAETETFPITVIKWNETESDTLKTSYRRGSGGEEGLYVSWQKIWLNDSLVLDLSNPAINGNEITIIK